jgi:hypothetical protein
MSGHETMVNLLNNVQQQILLERDIESFQSSFNSKGDIDFIPSFKQQHSKHPITSSSIPLSQINSKKIGQQSIATTTATVEI